MDTSARTQPTSVFVPGTLLRGKYCVNRLLGHGGMGVVVEALHLDLERRVAIKLLHADLQSNADLVERFIREGRAASRIEGEHVARVFDVDRLDDGTPFLVMEYLEGQDLSYVRKNQTPLPLNQAVDYVLQACSGVSLAHAAGVIHRDVKPANLFVVRTQDGRDRVKVLDFGISKVSGPAGSSEPSVTRTTIVMGSVEYMSPEQMLSTRNVDVRTDVWALGVVLFELLTAAPPFSGENTTQICAHVMSQPALKPRSLRPDLPQALETIIMRCLEKERERRFATVDELAAALRGFLETAAPAGAVAQGPATAHSPPRTQQPPTPRMPGNTPVPSPHPQAHPSDAPAQGSDPRLSLPTTLLPATTGTRVSLGVPSVGASSSTTVGVASDPIPAPPRRSSAGALYATIAAAGLGALGLFWFFLRSPQGSPGHPASQQPTLATNVESPANTGEPPGRSPSDRSTISVEPEVARPGANSSLTPSATASSAAHAETGATASAKVKSVSSAQKPIPTAKPASSPTATARVTPTSTKPSGID